MNILIVYATYSGGTQEASHIVEQTLKDKGNLVIVKTPSETTVDEVIKNDLVIFGSPSWDIDGKSGQTHEEFPPFLEKLKNTNLENKPFAVFGLGDKSYEHFCGAVDILEQFVKDKKGKLVVESLRINGFFFDQEANTKLLQEWSLPFPCLP